MVDATVGGGGHARRLLEARPDRADPGPRSGPRALAAAAAHSAPSPTGSRCATLASITSDSHERPGHQTDELSGVLFDLGVSSPQLDEPERGFSYRYDGPLDMRMDPAEPWSADDVVNGYQEAELARILAAYGDERFARRIAKAIVAARPIETTAELADIVPEAIPAPPAAAAAIRPSGRSRPSASRSTASSTSCPAPSTGPSRRPGPGAASPCWPTTRARTGS